MSKWILAAGAAAIALATPALADPGGNKGKGGGNDRGPQGGTSRPWRHAQADHQGHGARRPSRKRRSV